MARKTRDPRRPGAVCFHGQVRMAYCVLYRDGPDWVVEWEDGRQSLIATRWEPAVGDRVIRLGGWLDPMAAGQLSLFGEGETE